MNMAVFGLVPKSILDEKQNMSTNKKSGWCPEFLLSTLQTYTIRHWYIHSAPHHYPLNHLLVFLR